MPPLLLAVIVGCVVCQIAIGCTSVFLHRTVTHRALTLTPPVYFVFRVLVWITTGIRPRQWAAVHRRHHAFTDVAGDPHSPVLAGYWKVQLLNVALYRRCVRDGQTVRRYARDLPPDSFDRLFFDHALVGLGVGAVILWAALGWQYALVAAGVHVVIYLALNAAVNAVGHAVGRTPYPNTATNNQWLAWLTAGEGLHNNHHAAPSSARFALGRRECDPGWWLIRFLTWRHLAETRLAEPKFVRASLGRPVGSGVGAAADD